jgi:hypothetical protein
MKVLLCLVLRSFLLFSFPVRSVINSKLIFHKRNFFLVWGWRLCWPSIVCWKDYPFSIKLSLPSWLPILFNRSMYLFFHLPVLSLALCLKLKYCESSNIIPLSKLLDYFTFTFPYKFWSQFIYIYNESSWDFWLGLH